MRKVFGLVIGLLMLSGMMGMVSAFTPANIDGEDTDWGVNISTLPDNSWNLIDTQGWEQYVWKDAVGDYTIYSSGDVQYMRITSDSQYFYIYMKFNSELTLGGSGSQAFTILIDTDSTTGRTDFGSNNEWLWYANGSVNSTHPWNFLVRVDLSKFSGDGSYSGPYDSVGDGLDVLDTNGNDKLSEYSGEAIGISSPNGGVEIRIPRTAIDTDHFYVNFVTVVLIEYIPGSGILVAGDQEMVDAMDPSGEGGTGDDFLDTFNSVDLQQVPFFSNAGIAAVTLLLVIGAVWFFRRQ